MKTQTSPIPIGNSKYKHPQFQYEIKNTNIPNFQRKLKTQISPISNDK
jgi:hypothetical protein